MSRKPKRLEPFGIKGIEVSRFRAMHDLEIGLGQLVTVIAGQNGTSKSTILGMLGQPFGLRDRRTIFGRPFSTKFTDIFNMSPEHDIPGEHLYYVDFSDEAISGSQGQHVQVKSFKRPAKDKSSIRIVTGSSRAKGEGNIDYPVIYLGLKRTNPVGEFLNPQAEQTDFSESEVECFNQWYARVMVDQEKTTDVVRMSKHGQKEALLVNTATYDYLANSAGQDNLGQILGALISFERLADAMGEEYRGGLLLIDELDVTLFPSSQVRLFDLLKERAAAQRVQVVFTTHSMTLLEKAVKETQGKNDAVKVLYLKKRESGIRLTIDPPIEEIQADLMVEPLRPKKGPKVEIWCEDDEAKWVLGQIMPSRLKRKCDIVSAKLSCGELGELAVRDIASLRGVCFVVDADSNRGAAKKIKDCARRFVLPGGGKSPEQSIYDLLCGLSDEDDFWSNDRHYTKQVMLSRFADSKRDFEHNGGDKERKHYKKWFRREKAEGLWGENGLAVAAIWKERYESEIRDFNERLERRVDAIIKRQQYEREQ